MSRLIKLSVLLAAAVAATACGGEPAIIALPTWRLEPAFVISIGSAEEPQLGLDGVVGIVRRADGSIIIADRGSFALRFFDAEGREVSRVGRQGEGPGEFRDIGWLGRSADDSLYVWDWGVRRVSVFSPDGMYARRIEAHPSPDGGMRHVPAAVIASGQLIGRRRVSVRLPFPGVEASVAAESVAFGLLDRDGVWQWGTAMRAEGEVFGMLAPTGRGQSLVPVYRPFAAKLSWTIAHDTLIVADAARGAIEWLGPDGSTHRSFALARTRRSFTTASQDAYRDEATRTATEFAGSARAQADEAMVAALAAGKVPFPAQYPVFDQILVSDLGDVWLQDFNTDGAEEYRTEGRVGSRWWTVYSPLGQTIARIELPPEFQLRVVADRTVLGVWSNEDGVEFVRSYRIATRP